jgi:hypothetical protein
MCQDSIPSLAARRFEGLEAGQALQTFQAGRGVADAAYRSNYTAARLLEALVLRAIGATPARVAGIVVVEAVCVALLALPAALLAAWPITTGLGAA